MTKAQTRRTTRSSRTRARAAASKPAAKTATKQSIVLGLLRRQGGASIDEIIKATDWQAHSVRGFFAGALKKRLGIEVVSEKGEDGVRRYYVSSTKQ